MIHKNCLVGWLDNQIEKAEKEDNKEMVKAYTNVLNLILDANALKDLRWIEYHNKEGKIQTLTPIKVVNLTQFKMIIKEVDEDVSS